MIDNAFGHKKRHIVNLSYDFPTNVLIQEPRMGSRQCFVDVFKGNIHQEPRMGSRQCFVDVFKGNIHSAKMLTTTDCLNILNVSS